MRQVITMENIEEAEIKTTKKDYNKPANKRTKAGKYFDALQKGNTKEKAKIIAQYAPSVSTTHIEATKTFQAIEKTYLKDMLPNAISKQEVAQKLADNIRSDEGSTSNTAIKLFKDITEGEGTEQRVQDNIIVVFKGDNKDDTTITLTPKDATERQLEP